MRNDLLEDWQRSVEELQLIIENQLENHAKTAGVTTPPAVCFDKKKTKSMTEKSKKFFHFFTQK